MKGKVTDKATGAAIPKVLVLLTGQDGDYVEGSNGVVGTETDKKGAYQFDVSPGMYLSFEAPGYPRVLKSYGDLTKNGNVVMNDGTGTALEKKEITAYVKDARKISSGQWMIGVGIALFLLLIGIILAKRLGA